MNRLLNWHDKYMSSGQLMIYSDDIMYTQSWHESYIVKLCIQSDDMKDTWHWVWWCFKTWWWFWYLMTCSVWQIFLMTSGIDQQCFKMWMTKLTSENWESCVFLSRPCRAAAVKNDQQWRDWTAEVEQDDWWPAEVMSRDEEKRCWVAVMSRWSADMMTSIDEQIGQ